MKVFTIIFILTSLSITVAWAQSAKAEIATGLDIVNESGVAFLDFYRNGRSGYLEASGDDMRLVAEDDRLILASSTEMYLLSNSVVLDPNSGDDAILSSNPQDGSGDLFLESNDAVIARIDKNDSDNGNFFVWDHAGTNLFQVTHAGDVISSKSMMQGSDRNRKDNIVDLNYSEILQAVARMPIYEWQYQDQDRRHIGPMAQDFHTAFGLGDDDTTIATIDADGVAFAAIKAQQAIIEKQEEINKTQHDEIQQLRQEIKLIKELFQTLSSSMFEK